VAAIEVLPVSIRNNAINRARRQTWDSKRLLESRKHIFGRRTTTDNPVAAANLPIPDLRGSQESMANLVLMEY
jgi:hypothetical protein